MVCGVWGVAHSCLPSAYWPSHPSVSAIAAAVMAAAAAYIYVCVVNVSAAGVATEAVVHFLGGAFVGAAPQLAYRLFLESLASRGVMVSDEVSGEEGQGVPGEGKRDGG